jgi:outer membrane protein
MSSLYRFAIACVVVLTLFSAGCDTARQVRAGSRSLAASGDKSPAEAPSAVADASVPDSEQPAGPMELTVTEAILASLARNKSFSVQRLQPSLKRLDELIQESAYDADFSASVSGKHSGRVDDPGTGNDITDTGSGTVSVGVKKTYPSGAGIEATASTGLQSSSGAAGNSRSTGIDITFTQALLRGKGIDFGLARLRQARIDTAVSEFELRAVAESLVAQVENAYWDYALAQRVIEIRKQALELAVSRSEEVSERVRVGRLPESELPAANATVADSRQQLIKAEGTLAKNRLALLRLLGAAAKDSEWNRDVVLLENPEMPEQELAAAESHTVLAMAKRADIAQARLAISRGDIEVERTANGLLPKLDLFVKLGGTLYSSSFAATGNHGNEATATVGVTYELPVGNRSARALYAKAQISAESARIALSNMEGLAQQEVRGAYIDALTAAESIAASTATRMLREKTLEVETEKFRVGRSTTLLVSQAQYDLVASRIAEIEAIVGYRKSLVNLYKLEGTLLERRGVKGLGDSQEDKPSAESK